MWLFWVKGQGFNPYSISDQIFPISFLEILKYPVLRLETVRYGIIADVPEQNNQEKFNFIFRIPN